MPLDTASLRRLAQEVNDAGYSQLVHNMNVQSFQSALSPDVVLALLAEEVILKTIEKALLAKTSALEAQVMSLTYGWNAARGQDVLNTDAIARMRQRIVKLESRLAQWQKAVRKLEVDNHYWQKRPCQTCKEVSEMAGRPFGCVKFTAALSTPGGA